MPEPQSPQDVSSNDTWYTMHGDNTDVGRPTPVVTIHFGLARANQKEFSDSPYDKVHKDNTGNNFTGSGLAIHGLIVPSSDDRENTLLIVLQNRN
jgi:hypothetical protein